MRSVRLACSVLLAASLFDAAPALAGYCPNVMWVVDKSAKMSTDTQGGGKVPTKWQLVLNSLTQTFIPFSERFPMGLEVFSSPGGGAAACFADTAITVGLGKGNFFAVNNALAKVMLGGLNNAGDAVRRAALDGKLNDVRRANFIVLVTTGKPDCNPDDAIGAQYTVDQIAQAFAQQPSIKTVVLGFDEGDATAIANLNAMALAGGVAQPNCVANKTPCYYPLTNANAVNNAFNAIIGPFAVCDDTCLGNGCPNGQVCDIVQVGGEPACIPDPCGGVNCKAEEYCRQGKCLRPCPHCGDDERCVVEECVNNPCTKALRDQCAGNNFTCDPDQGRCVANLCAANNKTCPLPTSCNPLTGYCALDPCQHINCPPNATCYGGYCMTDPPPPDLSMPDLVDVPFQFRDLWHEPQIDLGPPEPARSGCSCNVGHSVDRGLIWPSLAIVGWVLRRRRRNHGGRGEVG